MNFGVCFLDVAFCLQNGFRLRTLKCFYGLSDGSWKRGPGDEKPPSERGCALQPWQRSKGLSRDKAPHTARGLVLTSDLKPRWGPHSLPPAAGCIYLEQQHPKPCLHDRPAALTEHSQPPEHGASFMGVCSKSRRHSLSSPGRNKELTPKPRPKLNTQVTDI